MTYTCFFYSIIQEQWGPILAKNVHVQAPKNGTSSAPNQKRRPLFHANIPPKWWIRHLFHAFSNFGWVLSKFWKIAFFGLFWAVFLWARTQKLAGDVRGQFKSQWLNPNIFEFSEGSVTTISACHLKILMFSFLATLSKIWVLTTYCTTYIGWNSWRWC